MKRQLGLKYRLDPTPQQAARLRVLAGHARFVWNRALAECHAARERGEWVPRYGTMAGWITTWKREASTTFLTEAYTDNLQQKLRDLDTAWQRHFTPGLAADAPRFKKKGKSRDAIRFVNFPKYCRLDHRRVKLPAGLGWVRFRQSRPVVGKITSCTVGLDSGHWHISFQVEIEVEEPPRHPATAAVALDMGVAHFAVDSNGTPHAGRNSFRQLEQRIATAQRRLKHKTRLSRNWKKQKSRIARLHQKAANVRRDTLHKLSTTICKNHAMVAVEDLRVSNMTASAKGTLAAPGRQVKQKTGLNKAILDQGWFEFRRQLTYKQAWRGGLLVAVPPHHTSQTCPECGHVEAANRLSRASFRCQACGHADHADVVGARNILAKAHEHLSGQVLPVEPVK